MAGFGDKSDATIASFVDRAPDQTAYVVPDLRASIEAYGRLMGIADWVCWDYTADYLPHRFYDGRPSDYRSLAAVPHFGPKIEFIQPITGPSVFTDFLDTRPQGGLHHLGYFVPDMQEVRDWFGARGVKEIMSGGGHGVDGDGEFTYFDISDQFGSYLEFIQVPERRHAPHFSIHVDLDD